MTRRAKAAAAAVGLVVVVGLGAPRVFQPATLRLAQAIAALGPISGWRCTQSASYVYDPRRDRADSTLLAEPPEAILRGVEVERVEASLRGGDTVVWTRVATDDASGAQRVYVLSPGRLQAISVDRPGESPITLCTAHQGDWTIVAEHGL